MVFAFRFAQTVSLVALARAEGNGNFSRSEHFLEESLFEKAALSVRLLR